MQTVVYDLDPVRDEGGAQAADVLGAGIKREQGLVRIHSALFRAASFTLEDGTDEGTVAQGVRGGALVAEWQAAELLYEAPTDTTVRARLHDGATSYFHDGAAWVEAGADDWNTPEEVQAAFDEVPPALARIGVEWHLAMTDDAQDPPHVYGALLAAGLMFAARYGTAADGYDEGRPDGWTDDLIHRVLLPLFEDFEPEMSHQAPVVADTDFIDFSNGLVASTEVDGTPADVLTVQEVLAVYDLTAGPDLSVQVPGTWDLETRSFTTDDVVPAGTELLIRARVKLHTGFMGDADYFTDLLPILLIEGFDADEETAAPTPVYVRDLAGATALQVPAPYGIQGTVRCRIEAPNPVVAFQVHQAVRQRMGGKDGLQVLSAGTGMEVSIQGPFSTSVDKGPVETPGTLRFELDVRTQAWYGAADTVPLLQRGGFQPTLPV